jgi:hypothetical protein
MTQMKITSALGFPFRGPHAWANLGLTLVCVLIPVVGPIVMMGYLVGVQRSLAENIEADAPRFEFSRFTFYLMRGLWPFLVGLVLGLIPVPLLWGCMAVGFVGGFLTQHHVVLGVALIVVAVLAYLGMLAVFSVATSPLILKAGLQEKFEAGFDRRFLWDYMKRVGLLALGTGVLMLLISVPVLLASVCLFFVGPMAVAVWLNFAYTHIQMQLYREYIARGGTPIVMKPEAPPSAFPVILSPPPASP